MIIRCPNCNKQFKINPSLIPDNGRDLKCGSCDHVWFYKIEDKNLEPLSLKKGIIDNEDKLDIVDKKIAQTNEVKKSSSHSKIDTIEKEDLDKIADIQIPSKNNIKNTSGKFFSYIIVFIISFVALIILIDTLKTPLINIFPGLGNDIRSAVNKIDYAKNLFYRRGIENTGTPFIFKSTKWFKNDSSYVFSWKGYDYKMRYDNIDNNEKPSLKGLIDINHYVRSQFNLKYYKIVDDWEWSKSNKLITFEYKKKIYQLTWNNFQQGILINDDETNIYFVEMKYNDHKCKKIGISINEPDFRSTSYKKIIFSILLPTDLAIQLEKLTLAKTKMYVDRSTKLSNFRGKSECRKIIMPDKFVIDYLKFYSEKLLIRKEKLKLRYL
ncbi:zinc-ribbon domain-containing protein [Candidatus Pelagibacter sp.]|nr:zinc-ribbon domain-containing protein [Candidatus Pelagibacter sp.]